ncbi:hypothetical protein [Lentzea sp. NPDC059081]|uniref:hypothetical protein n=1 Tax=Lentzea sp. NPDC059081 TaxID=3346719 RepID=UPI0036745C4C
MTLVHDVDSKIHHLGAGEPNQLLRVANTIADRFQHLDTTAWLVSSSTRRARIMQGNVSMWAKHALDYGEVHLATHSVLGTGPQAALVSHAAAIWLHYDRADGSPPPLPVRYRERLAADCGRYAHAFAQLDEMLDKHHPADRGPHHYLAFLAAARSGHGHGSALLSHHLSFLDARELGAYLVAADARSRDLYARFGFEVLHPALELPHADGRGPAHVMYPMWRDPQPPQPQPDHDEPDRSHRA